MKKRHDAFWNWLKSELSMWRKAWPEYIDPQPTTEWYRHKIEEYAALLKEEK